jgi:hypothetical protein
MKFISEKYLKASMSYEAFLKEVETLLMQGRTTNNQNSPAMQEYTRMNLQRIKRLSRKFDLSTESKDLIRGLKEGMIWLVLTEGWCGDAAQSLPVIAALARENEKVDLRILLRDQHPELMDAFLTNGSRSIPKLIMVDAEEGGVLADWGPRPAELQAYIMKTRQEILALSDQKERSERFKALSLYTQKWYTRDKGTSIQREILDQIPMEVES